MQPCRAQLQHAVALFGLRFASTSTVLPNLMCVGKDLTDRRAAQLLRQCGALRGGW